MHRATARQGHHDPGDCDDDALLPELQRPVRLVPRQRLRHRPDEDGVVAGDAQPVGLPQMPLNLYVESGGKGAEEVVGSGAEVVGGGAEVCTYIHRYGECQLQDAAAGEVLIAAAKHGTDPVRRDVRPPPPHLPVGEVTVGREEQLGSSRNIF